MAPSVLDDVIGLATLGTHVCEREMKDVRSFSQKVEAAIPDEILVRTFAKLDALALGLAVGIVSGIGLFAATAILILKGGRVVGPNLKLLANYLPHFAPTWAGSVYGGLEAGLLGFAVGASIALLRNLVVAMYVYVSAFWGRLDRFLDDM